MRQSDKEFLGRRNREKWGMKPKSLPEIWRKVKECVGEIYRKLDSDLNIKEMPTKQELNTWFLTLDAAIVKECELREELKDELLELTKNLYVLMEALLKECDVK